MPAMEYSRGTAGNIFTRFHIMAFLCDDLKVIDVSINFRFKFFMGRNCSTIDGIRNKSNMRSNLYFLDFFHFL